MSASFRTGAPSSLRRVHRGLALSRILATGGVSRTMLANELGLSQMGVSRVVRDLMDAGLVEEAGHLERETGPGRSQTLLRIRPDGVFACGIALSAYGTEIAIADAVGGVIGRRRVRVESHTDGQRVIDASSHALVSLIAELDIPRERIAGVGIAVAAHLDSKRRCIVGAGYLGWKPFDLVSPVERITGLPVQADNITNALALAERSFGVARDASDVVLVRSATSLGAATLRDGRVVRGYEQRAGRIGHFRHGRTGLVCSCGRNDCLNCSASGWSVLARLGIVSDPTYRTEMMTAYADAIDQLAIAPETRLGAHAVRTLRAAGAALADALQIVDLFLEPEVLVLDGSMSRVAAYVEGMRRRLEQSGEQGRELAGKLRIGEVRSVKAAAMLVLLDRVYSPALDLTTYLPPIGTSAGDGR
ncbi:MAG: ROK family protein [Hyphomicrobiaceae bacterium]